MGELSSIGGGKAIFLREDDGVGGDGGVQTRCDIAFGWLGLESREVIVSQGQVLCPTTMS